MLYIRGWDPSSHLLNFKLKLQTFKPQSGVKEKEEKEIASKCYGGDLEHILE